MTDALRGGLTAFAMLVCGFVIYQRKRGWTVAKVWYRLGALCLTAGDATVFFYSRWQGYRARADKLADWRSDG